MLDKSQKNIERRKERRTKLAPDYVVKARVRMPGKSATDYFQVNDLGMGGLSLMSKTNGVYEMNIGDTLEVLLFRKNISLRVMAQVLENKKFDSGISDNGNDVVRVRAKIIGIDDRSRETLATFLEELVKSSEGKAKVS